MNQQPHTLPKYPAQFPPFRLANWTITPSRNTLEGPGETITLEPRIMHVLVCLAARAQAVVSRHEILDTVWQDVVVQEEALTYAISQLRRFLGDDAKSPQLIETIRKGGYRLKVAIEPLADVPHKVTGTAQPDARVSSPRRPRRLARLLWIVAAVVFALGGTAYWYTHRQIHDTSPALTTWLTGVPLTSQPGHEVTPAVSPDGTRIAFSSLSPDGDRFRLGIKQCDSETVLFLTEDAGHDLYPAWSPDGAQISFCKKVDDRWQVAVIPSLGGEVTLISSPHMFMSGVDWSPDGKTLVYACSDDPEQASRLVSLDWPSRQEQDLTEPPQLIYGDGLPRYSPDGQTLAFVRGDQGNFQDLYLLKDNQSKPTRLTHGSISVTGVDWSADGQHLIYGTAKNGKWDLWILALVAPDNPRRLSTRSARSLAPSVARKTDLLVYQEQLMGANVFGCTLDPASATMDTLEATEPFAVSTRLDYSARICQSTNDVLFLSNRSGHHEIWVCTLDGRQLRQVTSLKAQRLRQPRWSPDGQRIAFNAAIDAVFQLFVVDVASGAVHQITDGDVHHRFGLWSHNGQDLYYSAQSGDSWQFWAVNANGGPGRKIITKGCMPVYESADGWLYYHKMDKPGIWRMRQDGRDENCAATIDLLKGRRQMVFVDEGIYLSRWTPSGNEIAFIKYASEHLQRLCRLPEGAGDHLTLSADRTYALFDLDDPTSNDLILVRDWH